MGYSYRGITETDLSREIERVFSRKLKARVLIHDASEVDEDACLTSRAVTIYQNGCKAAVSRCGFLGYTEIVDYLIRVSKTMRLQNERDDVERA